MSTRLALPSGVGVDVGKLASLFDHATNSYKYLLFGAIFDLLRDSSWAPKLAFSDVSAGMLARAYFPTQVFRLTLGPRDKVFRFLPAPGTLPINASWGSLRYAMCRQVDVDMGEATSALLRYAIFRLLRPFFREELYGTKDSEVDAAIQLLASKNFESARPLYRVSHGEIEMHPRWCAYLQENAPVVRDWFMWHWSNYLLSRNPNVPSVSRKVGPTIRASLQEQRRYWVDIMQSESLCCIYSQQPLSPAAFDLDHYLPWTFVAHDQIWNLLPVSKEANRAKSDRVPDIRYLRDLAHLQLQALARTHRANPRRWRIVADQFRCDLRIATDQALLSESALTKAYVDTVGPLANLAATMGFETGWQYAPTPGGTRPRNDS